MQSSGSFPPSSIKRIWTFLVGRYPEISLENRAYNLANIFTLLMLSVFVVSNVVFGLYNMAIIVGATFLGQLFFYYLSRFKKRYRTSIIINAIESYFILGICFIYNSGANGPLLLMFFLTFQLLVVSTNKHHFIWLLLHIITVGGLLTFGFFYPHHILDPYTTPLERYVDIFLCYTVTALCIYFLTLYLRTHYRYEKNLAKQRLSMIEEQNDVLRNSEAKLNAFFQSSKNCHVLLSSNMEIVAYNQALVEFVSNFSGKTVGVNQPVTDFLTDAYKPAFSNHFRTALNGKTISEERQVAYQDGHLEWWNLSFSPVKDKDHSVLGVALEGVNVNERVLHEQSIESKNAALMDIAQIQSHEFRGPVASVLGLLNVIREENFETPKEYVLAMEEVMKDLDARIHEVVAMTQEL